MAPSFRKNCLRTYDWCGPETRAFETLGIIQLRVFPEKLRHFHYTMESYSCFVRDKYHRGANQRRNVASLAWMESLESHRNLRNLVESDKNLQNFVRIFGIT